MSPATPSKEALNWGQYLALSQTFSFKKKNENFAGDIANFSNVSTCTALSLVRLGRLSHLGRRPETQFSTFNRAATSY
jgi:hypothetical protein